MDWTVDYWFYDQAPTSSWGRHLGQAPVGTYDGWHIGKQGTTGTLNFGHDSSTVLLQSSTVISANTWYHLCLEHDDSEDTVKLWLNGVLNTTVTGAQGTGQWTWHTPAKPFLMGRTNPGGADFDGFLDEVRISKGICRTQDSSDPLYISTGTGFSVPTAAYSAAVMNAAGNFTSATQTAVGTVSKMSIVVLYKNASGTATLDTDLVAQVSSNGGTNYTSAPLTAAGTFSTGVLMAKSNDITISNTGTAPKYKISFANQADASKETQVYGVALLY